LALITTDIKEHKNHEEREESAQGQIQPWGLFPDSNCGSRGQTDQVIQRQGRVLAALRDKGMWSSGSV